ncbi:MAG: disulfide bond formation protein B [Candidatus Paceibacterota bacterium]
MSLLNTLNLLFASGGLVLAVVTIGLYVDYFYNESRFFNQRLVKFAGPIVMVTTIGTVATTLLYSEYFGFIPCSLCWLQRIAMYPQALLSVIAFKMKDQVFFPIYGIALSIFGFIVAVYHYIYQMQPKEAGVGGLPCLADGSADCASKVIDMFGFVTFPLLSAITFAFLIVVYMNMRRDK